MYLAPKLIFHLANARTNHRLLFGRQFDGAGCQPRRKTVACTNTTTGTTTALLRIIVSPLLTRVYVLRDGGSIPPASSLRSPLSFGMRRTAPWQAGLALLERCGCSGEQSPPRRSSGEPEPSRASLACRIGPHGNEEALLRLHAEALVSFRSLLCRADRRLMVSPQRPQRWSFPAHQEVHSVDNRDRGCVSFSREGTRV